MQLVIKGYRMESTGNEISAVKVERHRFSPGHAFDADVYDLCSVKSKAELVFTMRGTKGFYLTSYN